MGDEPGAAPVIAFQIPPHPDHVRRLRIETGQAVAAPAEVDASLLDDRRGRSKTVELPGIAGLFDLEHHEVMQYPAALQIDAHSREFPSVLGRSRQPDPVAPDDRRGPSPAVDGCLPDDVSGLAPLERQVIRRSMAVRGGAPERRPRLGCLETGRYQHDQAEAESAHQFVQPHCRWFGTATRARTTQIHHRRDRRRAAIVSVRPGNRNSASVARFLRSNSLRLIRTPFNRTVRLQEHLSL